MPNDEVENKHKEAPAVTDDAAAAAKDSESSAADAFRSESFSDMKKESGGKIARPEEPKELDFGPKSDKGDKAKDVEKPEKEKNPFDEWREQMRQQVEKERQENINKIVESLAKDGRLPDNVQDMFRDFEPRMNAGYHGDAEGLKDYVNEINKKLREAGAPYSLDVTQLQQHADPRRGMGGGAYQSWTENVITVRHNKNGRATESLSVITDPIAKPGIRF